MCRHTFFVTHNHSAHIWEPKSYRTPNLTLLPLEIQTLLNHVVTLINKGLPWGPEHVGNWWLQNKVFKELQAWNLHCWKWKLRARSVRSRKLWDYTASMLGRKPDVHNICPRPAGRFNCQSGGAPHSVQHRGGIELPDETLPATSSQKSTSEMCKATCERARKELPQTDEINTELFGQIYQRMLEEKKEQYLKPYQLWDWVAISCRGRWEGEE